MADREPPPPSAVPRTSGATPGGVSAGAQPSVRVRLHGTAHEVARGTPLRQLLPLRMHGELVVAALVDRRLTSLGSSVTRDCEVTALTTGHWEGQSIHRRSLCLLALEAATHLDPPARIALGPSLGFARQVAVLDAGGRELDALARDLSLGIQALARRGAVLREEWWTLDEARERFRDADPAAAALLATWRDPSVPVATYGRVSVLGLGPLLPDGAAFTDAAVAPGDGVLLLMYGSEAAARPIASSVFPSPPTAALEPGVPDAFVAGQARRTSAHVAALTEGQGRWLEALGIRSVGAFNGACVTGNVSQLIRVSEGFQEKRLGAIADDIAARAADVRVVCIAGPSSSGKTTFIRRLEVQLQVNGLTPRGLSLDDYYVDRARTPRDATGDLDYEALEAIDLVVLGRHVEALLRGDRGRTARYDFQTGTSHAEGGRELTLGAGEVLLLEGIHGLNPRLLGALSERAVYRVFVCPLAQLPFDALHRVHASDVRLLRRIVRDRHGRGTNAADNIARWPKVRAGERRHIFPFQHHADAVFDSSLVYELGVLRVYAERYLLEVPEGHPSAGTAFRLIRLLDRFVTLYPDHVPPTSLLREFIGGSGFDR